MRVFDFYHDIHYRYSIMITHVHVECYVVEGSHCLTQMFPAILLHMHICILLSWELIFSLENVLLQKFGIGSSPSQIDYCSQGLCDIVLLDNIIAGSQANILIAYACCGVHVVAPQSVLWNCCHYVNSQQYSRWIRAQKTVVVDTS